MHHPSYPCPTQEAGLGALPSHPRSPGRQQGYPSGSGDSLGSDTNTSCSRGFAERLPHLSCCVSLGKLLSSGPQRPHLLGFCGDMNMKNVRAYTLRLIRSLSLPKCPLALPKSLGVRERWVAQWFGRLWKPTPSSGLSCPVHWCGHHSLGHFFPLCDRAEGPQQGGYPAHG